MSFDDDLRTGLDDAAELLPIDQTVALAAAKSQGRKGVRKRRVLAASGSVLTASALLVGALSLVQDSSPDAVVADETESIRSVCDGAYPTAEGLDATRFEAIDETTWTVDGHTLIATDSRQLSRDNLVVGESRHVWTTVGATERETWRQMYDGLTVTELSFAGMHLPVGCEVVLRLDAGIDQGGRLVLGEFEQAMVWPASTEPEPLVVNNADPICGPVAPFQSAELNDRFDEPEAIVDEDGHLTMRWADAVGSVEVRHPAEPEATETLTVRIHRGGPECDRAALITTGDVSAREARDVLRPVNPDLVDVDTRLGTGVQTSSKVQNAPPATATVPLEGGDTAD